MGIIDQLSSLGMGGYFSLSLLPLQPSTDYSKSFPTGVPASLLLKSILKSILQSIQRFSPYQLFHFGKLEFFSEKLQK